MAADLRKTNLHGASLIRTCFRGSRWQGTLVTSDLSCAEGLGETLHSGPSVVSPNLLLSSQVELPLAFLLGCGVPQALIDDIPALRSAGSPIQYHSCFISYSTQDEDFARRLHARLQEEKLRVWFAPAEMKGGETVLEQIEQAIQVYDKLLLVLSPSSIRSSWVELELRAAREREEREGVRMLFPISLASRDELGKWQDLDSGRELVMLDELEGYFLPDFSNWEDNRSFEAAVSRLLGDLKNQQSPSG